MAMAADRTALFAVPAAAALLLWPALWNGFPIVFADTGTYLSQAINHHAGWDRPVFYSLFMLPLHGTVTVWPIVVVQALLAAAFLWLVVHVLAENVSGIAFVAGVALLSGCTWLPWLVCELMPDLFTPLLVLALCLLALAPDRLPRHGRSALVGLAAFMIATQLSSLPLAGVLGLVLLAAAGVRRPDAGRRQWWWADPSNGLEPHPDAGPGPESASALPATGPAGMLWVFGNPTTTRAGLASGGVQNRYETQIPKKTAFPPPNAALDKISILAIQRRLRLDLRLAPRRWLLIILPPALAILALCSVNLAVYGRFSTSPFGSIFLLARVVADGPGREILRRDCPAAHWRLCPFADAWPATSDGFLWPAESPLYRAGGPKLLSHEAWAIIEAAVIADPVGEARAALRNTIEQLTRFDSGDGLQPWPEQVSPWIVRDFPPREQAAYAAARQQSGSLKLPPLLLWIHRITAVGGVAACLTLLPAALMRRAACAGFLLTVLVMLPVSAAITGALSAPHDRYQARIMWLPPFIAVVSLASLLRRPD